MNTGAALLAVLSTLHWYPQEVGLYHKSDMDGAKLMFGNMPVLVGIETWSAVSSGANPGRCGLHCQVLGERHSLHCRVLLHAA